MHRYLLPLISLVLVAGCASQSGPRPGSSDHPASGNTVFAPKDSPFIRRTAIIYSAGLKDLRLSGTYRYPNAVEGVQIRYKTDKYPKARLDLFVYPAGALADTAAGLNQEMSNINGQIKALQDSGIYQDVKFEASGSVEIDSAKGLKISGRESIISLTFKEKKIRSLAYIFYKQYYWIEVRISVPGITEEAVQALGSEVLRGLVPEIRVQSYGSCGHEGIAITESTPTGSTSSKPLISDDGFSIAMPDDDSGFAAAVVDAAFEQLRHGCSNVTPVMDRVFKTIAKAQSNGELHAMWLRLSAEDWERIAAREGR